MSTNTPTVQEGIDQDDHLADADPLTLGNYVCDKLNEWEAEYHFDHANGARTDVKVGYWAGEDVWKAYALKTADSVELELEWIDETAEDRETATRAAFDWMEEHPKGLGVDHRIERGSA